MQMTPEAITQRAGSYVEKLLLNPGRFHRVTLLHGDKEARRQVMDRIVNTLRMTGIPFDIRNKFQIRILP